MKDDFTVFINKIQKVKTILCNRIWNLHKYSITLLSVIPCKVIFNFTSKIHTNSYKYIK